MSEPKENKTFLSTVCGIIDSFIVAWFFALDHQNYSTWISIHIQDIESLSASIYEEFTKHGNWVVKETTNRFFAITIDQLHE